MKLKLLPLILLVLFIGSSVSASASVTYDCTRLTRNLRLGMSGNDVMLLQQLLNKQIATRVSETGPGSPGNEGMYFGAKTLQAVKHFQELYAAEVLIPAGLSAGSGFVGALSRAKLSTLCNASVSSLPTTPLPITSVTTTTHATSSASYTLPSLFTDISQPAAATSGPRAYIMFPASYAVPQGGKIVIFGGGYDSNNTVHLGDQSWSNIKPTAKNTLEVPLAPDAAKGKFDLWFSNSKGTTSKRFVIVTAPNAVAPKVTSFTPGEGLLGTLITIKGENFSPDWNQIVVGSAIVPAAVSSDGTQLAFTISIPVPGVNTGQDVSGVNLAAPIWFYVINPNGVSGPSVFHLKI